MRNHKAFMDDIEEHSYWQSYSDMMAALLLLFVLLMSSTLLVSMQLYEQRAKEKEQAAKDFRGQQVLLQEQQKLLDRQQEQIDQLVGILEDLIMNLSKELSKTNLNVMVDPKTGAITFDSNILFSSGSYELTEAGKAFLQDFVPVYFSALLEGDYEEYISEIIIEGHTDTDGSYMFNLELSQKRALSVSQYCLQEAEEIYSDAVGVSKLRQILTANGRSWSNPILDAQGNVDMDASRRVEFKFRLKDDEMISKMKGILEE